MSGIFRRKLRCYLDAAPEPLDLWIDQRDISALERNRAKAMSELPPVEAMRWTAWNCARRTLNLAKTWEEWERDCIEVQPIEDEEVRPTEPAPGGE